MAESIGELYVNLTAKDGGFTAGVGAATTVVEKLEGASEQLATAVAKVEAPMEAAGAAIAEAAQQAGGLVPKATSAAEAVERVGASSRETAGSTSRMGERIKNVAGEMAEALVRFAADAVGAFLGAEKVTKRLELAVARAAGSLPGFAGRLAEAADAMERATGVDSDFIKSLQQMALQLQVAPSLVERTTKAALDFSEATGASAKSAMLLLTTATAENLDQLKKWGVNVSEAEVQARGLTAILERFEGVYGGATSQMHEASKSLALNKAAWGDLKEAIGQAVVETLHFSGASQKSAEIMDAWTELLTSKAAKANAEHARRVEKLNLLRDQEAGFLEDVRKAEEQLATARESGQGLRLAEQTLAIFQEQLSIATRLRREALGFTPVPTMRLPEMDLGAGTKKAIELEQKAAKDANARILKATIDELNDTINALGNLTVDVEKAGSASLPSAAKEFAAGASPAVSALSAQMKASAEAQAQALARAAAETQAAAATARDALVNRALGSLGELGGIISNAAQAASAGPLAAVASVLLDLLSRSETFKAILETISGILQTVGDALGRMLEPLLPLVGAAGMVAEALVPIAATLVELAVSALEPLAPVLVVVATLLQGLAPLLTVLMQAVQLVQQPFLALAGPVLKGLFTVLKTVSVVVLTVAKAIGDAWNFIIRGVLNLLRELEDVPLIGGALGDLADSLDRFRVDTDGLGQALKDLKELDWDSSMDRAKDATERFRSATDKATEALDNVPAIWRRQLRTGQAQDRQGPPGAGGGTAPPRPPPPGMETGPGAGGGLVRPPVLSTPVTGAIGGAWDRANDLVGGALTGKVTQIFSISGYELGPALQQAHRLAQSGAERRSYNSAGSMTSTATVRFGTAFS